MLTILSDQNSLLGTWVGELRDTTVQTDRMRFRRNMERIGEVAAYEISKTLEFDQHNIVTPMGESSSPQLRSQPVLATILRAGIPLHQGLLNYYDKADCAFVAAFRKHHRDGSFEIEQKYLTCPPMADRTLIIADPMLASGASLLISLDVLHEHGNPQAVHIVTAIATTTGIEQVLRKYPQAKIWAGAVDEELTARGYIVPGLGDAGDLAYGSKRQF